MQKFDHNNANFFRRKLSKNAENCDHNIEPWDRFSKLFRQKMTFLNQPTNLNYAKIGS
jgi:hypothetical protein